MRIRSVLLLSILCLVGFVFTPSCFAQKKKVRKQIARLSKFTEAQFTGLVDRMSLRNTSSFYNPTTDELVIRGKFRKIPAAIPDPQLRALLNGVDIVSIPGATFGVNRNKKAKRKFVTADFSASIPLAGDEEWPVSGVSIQLVYRKTYSVLARKTVHLYDLRDRPQSNPDSDLTSPIPVAIDYQLSDRGLGKGPTDMLEGLEIPVFAESPFPSLEDFNQRLGSTARQIGSREVEELRACISYSDLEQEKFKNVLDFPAYASAFAQAQAFYQAYLEVQSGAQTCAALFGFGSLICQAGIQNMCVKSPPGENDFELCVDTISGKPKDLSVEDLTDIELSFESSLQPDVARIVSEIDFINLEGLLDARLSDLIVRWKDGTCVGRPFAASSNAIITQKAWLDEWTTCPDMTVTAPEVSTKFVLGGSHRFDVSKSPSDQSQVRVTDSRLPAFGFSTEDLVHEKNTCALPFITEDAEAFLSLYRNTFQFIVSMVWNQGSPQTKMAELLDTLMKPIDVDTDVLVASETLPFRLIPRVESIASEPLSGMFVTWDTLVEPLGEALLKRLLPSFFTQGSFNFGLAADALDHLSVLFDSRVGVSMATVNNILWAHGASDDLNGDLELIGADAVGTALGSVFSGSGPLQPITLTGDNLALLDSGFDELAGKPVELVLRRVFDPMLYVPRDPRPQQQIPQVGFPIYYGIDALQLTIKAPDRVTKKGRLRTGESYVVFNIYLREDDFHFEFDSVSGSVVLDPSMPSPFWTFLVADSNLKRCPMAPKEIGVPPKFTCQDAIAGAMSSFLRNKLNRTFLKFVSDIPVPQYFDVQGITTEAVQSENQSREQYFARTNLYSQIETLQ